MKPRDFLAAEAHPEMADRRNVYGKITRAVVDAVYALFAGNKQPSSCRNAGMYAMLLFPEFETTEEVVDFVRRRDVLDIGSGLTHRSPYSLLNQVARQSDGVHRMIGVEPRSGYPTGHQRGFSKRNVVQQRVTDDIRDMMRRILRWPLLKDLPGEDHVIPCDARKLPFPDGSIDQWISSFCYPWWIDGEALAPIFREATRLLAPGGQIRLGPINKRDIARMKADDAIVRLWESDFEDIALLRSPRRFAVSVALGWPSMVLTKTSGPRVVQRAAR
jgi:SAM-dependent methyltransferase